MSPINRIPPYMQVVHDIRKQILTGTLADGDRLPSVREIAETWDISMATGHKVVATLRADGLIESQVGVGSTVRTRETLHRSAQDRWARMLQTGRIYAPGEYAVITSAGLAPAPTHIADALGLEEGEEAARRERITHNAEDEPISASVSWFHPELATAVPALLEPVRIPGGTPAAIQEATGRAPHSAEDRTWADAADADQAERLGLSAGDPVLVGRNILRDQDGDVLEAGEHVTGPRRAQMYQYELGTPA